MTPFEQQQARRTGVLYAEDHSVIRWPYYFHLVVWTVVLAGGIAAGSVTGDPDWSWPISLGFFGLDLIIAFLWKNWPVGIRIDDDGIRIGAVRRRPGPPGRQPWSDYQRWHQMHAPWDAVRRVAVITDKPGLYDARLLSKQYVNRIGVLTAPFVRAVLLIEIDPSRVTVPDFHEPHEKVPFWTLGHLTPFEGSPVWYVPTRHPDQLRAALAHHAASISGQSDPRLPAYLRILFERADVTDLEAC